MRRRRWIASVGGFGATMFAGCVDTETSTGGHGANASADDGGAEPSDGELSTATEWPADPYEDWETTTVAVAEPTGETRGRVTAVIAETGAQRYTGLSNATGLPEDGGMLFVYDEPRSSLTYVMREMDFGIDIVYADGERTITTIHNAPAPAPDADGNQQRYPGAGQFVLEVPYEWTDRHGVSAGDTLQFSRQ